MGSEIASPYQNIPCLNSGENRKARLLLLLRASLFSE